MSQQELTQNPITPETCFVPKTHEGKGRRTAVKPGPTAARFLHYGRITLGAGDAPEKFSNNDHETGLICLNGQRERHNRWLRRISWTNTMRFMCRAIRRSKLRPAVMVAIWLKSQRRLQSVIQ